MFTFGWMRNFSVILLIIYLSISKLAIGQTDLYKHLQNKISVFDSLMNDTAYDKIPNILNETLEISRQINQDSLYAKVYAMHAQYYHFTSDFEQASHYLFESAKLYEKVGNTIRSLKMYNNISVILNRNKQFEEALKIRKRILKIATQENEDRLIATTLINLGTSYRRLNKVDTSFYYLERALKYSKKNNLKDLIGSSYSSLQKLYLETKFYKLSLKYGDTISKFYRNDLNRGIYENSVSFSAEALYALKQYDESIEKCQLAIKLYKKINLTETLDGIYETLSKAYKMNGDFKKSLEAKERQVKIRDSILGIEKQKAIAELEEKFQNAKNEKENLQLKQESALKDLTISNKNNTILWSFLAFVIILFLLITYQLRKIKKSNKRLQIAIKEQTKLEKELTSVRDNIAQDFHDDLGNKLARISIFSQLLSKKLKPSNEKEKTMLQHIATDTNYLYKGTRDFIFSLKVESDYIEELATYLSDFGEDYFKEFNIDFEIEKQIESNKKLPYYWSKQLIYIFKEAMTNVAKHANASKVNLSFSFYKNILEIKCTDDGLGFNINELTSKNGLLNMEERAKKIKGRLDIISTKNHTEIAFVGNIKPKKMNT